MSRIGVGIGGWVFEPWRGGAFYPADLPQKRELEYASSKLTAIEVNGTYYSSQKPETFARWRDETPDDFVFTLKGPRFATNRRVLAEAGPSIEKFITSGIAELKSKLGPINWQFMGTKKFDAEDFEAFLKLLPKEVSGQKLRHAVEVRHESFACEEFVDLARKYNAGIIIASHETYPQIADLTSDFVYVRLQTGSEDEPMGYSEGELDLIAGAARQWATGKAPREHLKYAADPAKGDAVARDVFIFFIAGHKVKNPAAARALIEKI